MTYNLDEVTFEEPLELRYGDAIAVVQFVDGGSKLGGKVGDSYYRNKIYYKLEAEIGEAADG